MLRYYAINFNNAFLYSVLLVPASYMVKIRSTPVTEQLFFLKVKNISNADTKIRERNVLFNDTLNTFYLRLYGVRHMVKDHSDSEKGNPLPPHRLLLSINSKGSFICTIPHTGCFLSRYLSGPLPYV